MPDLNAGGASADAGAPSGDVAPKPEHGLFWNADGTVTHRGHNGEQTYWRSGTGTYYHAETPQALANLLDTLIAEAIAEGKAGRRPLSTSTLRLFLGDRETGRDWLEEERVRGYLAQMDSTLALPLLIASRLPPTGDAFLDHCIVRLQINDVDVWRHPNYHLPELTVGQSPFATVPFGVFADGKNVANFYTAAERKHWLAFVRGEAPTPAPLPARQTAAERLASKPSRAPLGR
jgi:hypothetical protein